MSRKCDICGKTRQLGNTVSHANNKSRREFRPNLFSVNADIDGNTKKIKVCSRCLRSGKVTKSK